MIRLTLNSRDAHMKHPSHRLVALTLACFACRLALGAATPPVAPKTFDTTYSPPSGTTITVNAGGNLQSALNSAQLGDTIVLQAGATFTGPFSLPAKTGSGWVYVVSSNYSSLPTPGNRVSPSNASNMPTLVAPANYSAVTTVANSNHFRFVGIQFAPAAGAFTYTLVTIGNSDKSPATLPSYIVFDRCYVHGDPKGDDIRGIEMDGAYVAVVDSYVSGFMNTGSDTQALWAYNTTGPLKIVDNYLEAAGENVMFGGADSAAASLVPSDIQIANNYFFKQLAWVGTSLDVKNLLEFKAVQRVSVSGNTFVNNPGQSQDGFALLVTPRNQSGNAPWSITADISITLNTFLNVGGGLNISGMDNPNVSQETARVLVRNNLIEVTGLGSAADGRAFQIVSGGTDITIDHNTVISTAPSNEAPDLLMAENTPKSNNLVFTNNLSTPTVYGFTGTGVGEGTTALNGDFTNWTFAKNVLVGRPASSYPANNFFPATIQAVLFTNYSGGIYTLASGSPYKNAGTDGLDIGANFTTAPTLTPDPPTNVSVQ